MNDNTFGPEHFGDITDVFDFLDHDLSYVDAPLSGFVRTKGGRRPIAFQCIEIIGGRLWHWALIPVQDVTDSCDSVFSTAIESPSPRWLSILEDVRTGEARLTAAWIADRCTMPVRDPREYED